MYGDAEATPEGWVADEGHDIWVAGNVRGQVRLRVVTGSVWVGLVPGRCRVVDLELWCRVDVFAKVEPRKLRVAVVGDDVTAQVLRGGTLEGGYKQYDVKSFARCNGWNAGSVLLSHP
jgi:hypothetical protein